MNSATHYLVQYHGMMILHPLLEIFSNEKHSVRIKIHSTLLVSATAQIELIELAEENAKLSLDVQLTHKYFRRFVNVLLYDVLLCVQGWALSNRVSVSVSACVASLDGTMFACAFDRMATRNTQHGGTGNGSFDNLNRSCKFQPFELPQISSFDFIPANFNIFFGIWTRLFPLGELICFCRAVRHWHCGSYCQLQCILSPFRIEETIQISIRDGAHSQLVE